MEGSADPDRTTERRWSIQQAVIVDAAVEQVWRWLADPASVSQWWCPPPTVTIDFEPEAGGDYTEQYRDDERQYERAGTIRDFVPGRRFSVRRAIGNRFGRTDIIDIELLAVEGGTEVVLEHSFPDIPDDRRADAEAFYAPGWRWSLQRLSELVTDSG